MVSAPRRVDPAQLVAEPVDVDHRARAHQPHPQHRHQALPAREDPRHAAMGLQRGHGLADARRAHVLVGGGLHCRAAPRVAQERREDAADGALRRRRRPRRRWRRAAAQIVSGLACSRCSLPSWSIAHSMSCGAPRWRSIVLPSVGDPRVAVLGGDRSWPRRSGSIGRNATSPSSVEAVLALLLGELAVEHLERDLVDPVAVWRDVAFDTTPSPRPQQLSITIFERSPLTGSRVNITPAPRLRTICWTPTPMPGAPRRHASTPSGR